MVFKALVCDSKVNHEKALAGAWKCRSFIASHWVLDVLYVERCFVYSKKSAVEEIALQYLPSQKDWRMTGNSLGNYKIIAQSQESHTAYKLNGYSM